MSLAIEKASVLHQKIQYILAQDWDPIGVKAIPEALDEYRHYVPSLYTMLISRKTVNDVFDYLAWLETEHMGLSLDRQRTLVIAEKLIELVQGE